MAYELDENDEWKNFHPFPHPLSIPVNDPNARAIDLNGDGIADYQDGNDDVSVLPVVEGDDSTALQTEPGLRLKLGEAAIASDVRAGLITDEDLMDVVDDNQMPLDNVEDREFEHPLGLFDFEVVSFLK